MARSIKLKSLTSLASQIVQFVTGLIITPFVVRNLGEDYFSLWVVFVSLISFEGFFLLGTGQALNRFIPYFLGKKDFNSLASLIRSHFIFTLGIYLLVIGSIFLGADFIFQFFNLPISIKGIFDKSLFWVLIGMGISMVNIPLTALNNGQENYFYYNLLSIISMIIRLLIILTFIDRGFLILPFAYIVSQLILLLGLLYAFFKGPINILKNKDWLSDFDIFKLALSFGAGSMLMYVADILRHQVDTFIILKFVGLTEITHYRVGITLITSINTLNAGLFGILLTRLSFHKGASEHEHFRVLALRSFFYSSYLASYFILGISLMAPAFLGLWMGEFDQSSLQIIYILLIPQLLMLTQFPSVNIMYSMDKHKVMGWMTLIESFINFGISIILVRQIGIIGVVVGTGVGFLISKGFVIPLLLKKYCQLSLREQLAQIGPQFLFSLILYIPLKFLFGNVYIAQPLTDFVMKCIVITISYFFLSKCTYKIFPKSEAEILSLVGIKRIFK